MQFICRLLRRAFSTSAQLTANPTTDTIATTKSQCEALFKERNLKRLVEKFKKFSENKRFRNKADTYKLIVNRLSSAKRFDWIQEILEDQKQYEEISKEGFNARLISLYGQSGMFDHAQRVFDEMPMRKCNRTALSFNALMAACANSNRLDMVDGLFRELPKKLGIEPGVVSYNIVIKAFCQMGLLDSGIALLDEMDDNNVKPDLATFNTLLYGFYVNGRFEDGDWMWSRMAISAISPDIRSYNAKLYGLALVKRTHDAIKLFEEMKSKGIKPDVTSYNNLIKGFVKEDNLEQAKHWYNKIWNSDCRPDKLTFGILIPFVCEKDDLGFAFELSKVVIRRKCAVHKTLLQSVVNGLVLSSKMEEAKELIQLGKDTDAYRFHLKLP